MRSINRATCEICKREIDVTEPGAHQWTAGWVMRRDSGGGHAVACAVRENRWAHRYCVDRLARGFIKQETLL